MPNGKRFQTTFSSGFILKIKKKKTQKKPLHIMIKILVEFMSGGPIDTHAPTWVELFLNEWMSWYSNLMNLPSS